MTDYVARQAALRARREAEGYYTPAAVEQRQRQGEHAAEYTVRVSGVAPTGWHLMDCCEALVRVPIPAWCPCSR